MELLRRAQRFIFSSTELTACEDFGRSVSDVGGEDRFVDVPSSRDRPRSFGTARSCLLEDAAGLIDIGLMESLRDFANDGLGASGKRKYLARLRSDECRRIKEFRTRLTPQPSMLFDYDMSAAISRILVLQFDSVVS